MVQRFNYKGLRIRCKTEKQAKIGLSYSKFMTLWWESSDRFIGEYNYIINIKYIHRCMYRGSVVVLSRNGGMVMMSGRGVG